MCHQQSREVPERTRDESFKPVGEFLMHLTKKSISTLTIVAMTSILLVPGLAMSDNGKTYKVTISNLTSGQAFTPPVLLTHSHKTGIFALGEAASPEIQAIAENGNSMPLLATLGADVEVHEVVAGMAPLVPAHNPGGTMFASSATFIISTRGKVGSFGSQAAMALRRSKPRVAWEVRRVSERVFVTPLVTP